MNDFSSNDLLYFKYEKYKYHSFLVDIEVFVVLEYICW